MLFVVVVNHLSFLDCGGVVGLKKLPGFINSNVICRLDQIQYVVPNKMKYTCEI